MSQDYRRIILCRDGLCISILTKSVVAWKIADFKFSPEDKGVKKINVLEYKTTGQKIVWRLMVSSNPRR